MAEQTFPSIAAFYAADFHRQWSGESDFGVMWRGLLDWPRYRVSLVHDTGELYAIEQRLGGGSVTLLGVIGGRCSAPMDLHRLARGALIDCPYVEAERVLRHWEHWCGEPAGLAWIRRRLRLASEGNLPTGGLP